MTCSITRNARSNNTKIKTFEFFLKLISLLKSLLNQNLIVIYYTFNNNFKNHVNFKRSNSISHSFVTRMFLKK
jgi:hypothetical protein